MRYAISWAIVLGVALLLDVMSVGINTAGAQSRGLFGNGGQSSGGGGRGTFGGSGLGGSGLGGSGLGGSGIGSLGTGGASPGGQGGGRLNDGSLINGPSGSGGFVGSDLAGLQRFIGSSQARAQAGSQRINRGTGQGFQSNQPDNQDSGPAQRKFRTRVRIGFRPVPISNTKVSEQLSQMLTKTLQANGMRVVISERTATLRGNLATHHQRRLAEQLALLEPGISRVRNEIVVTAPPDDLP